MLPILIQYYTGVAHSNTGVAYSSTGVANTDVAHSNTGVANTDVAHSKILMLPILILVLLMLILILVLLIPILVLLILMSNTRTGVAYSQYANNKSLPRVKNPFLFSRATTINYLRRRATRPITLPF